MFLYSLTTLALFSKSDVVPILGPSIAVAMVLAGPTDLLSFFMGFLWLELHLLAFEIKNQITGLDEDRLSKPDRPIAAGRISVASAQRLYIFVSLCAIAWSTYHGLIVCTTVYMVAIVCYNEFRMSRHWFCKSFLGAIGYAVYCWGTTSIFDHGNALSPASVVAIACSFLLHVTTGHAQDFRDLSGDAAIGRRTLPMLLPSAFARWSLTFLIALWTATLVAIWKPPVPTVALFALLGAVASWRFIRNGAKCGSDPEREDADGDAYWWYNMWLITAHLLPLFTPVVDPLAFLRV
uniref:Integral membrane protein n=1 Tax=Mycena chlorophos TaxID=658473 RepID=A0ABQ0L0H4_MYCCL|nr:integral membrane protein [Mycena chlorophos]